MFEGAIEYGIKTFIGNEFSGRLIIRGTEIDSGQRQLHAVFECELAIGIGFYCKTVIIGQIGHKIHARTGRGIIIHIQCIKLNASRRCANRNAIRSNVFIKRRMISDAAEIALQNELCISQVGFEHPTVVLIIKIPR